MTSAISNGRRAEHVETARAATPPTIPERGRIPGVFSASMARAGWELRSFFRNPTQLVFILAFPIMLLFIFGAIFNGPIEGTNTDFKQYFAAGITAGGVMSTAFSGLALGVAAERGSGLMRRLADSPMPKGAYFIGKIVLVAVTSLLEAAILIAVGRLFFGLELPTDSLRWGVLVGVLLVGTAACALMGLAWSAVIPNAQTASATVMPPFLILQFISGVYYPFHALPDWMQTVASVFPLAWMTRGLRFVFLPDAFQAVERGGAWNLQMVAIVLCAWVVFGGFLTAVTFRWRSAKIL